MKSIYADREHNRNLAWGLNLSEPDVTSEAEIDEFRRISASQLGAQQDGLDYWLTERPDVLKRYRLWTDQLNMRDADEAPNKWTPTGVLIQYLYSMSEFEDGLRYNALIVSRRLTKAQALEQFALVFRYVGPRGMATLAKAVKQIEWTEPTDPVVWPVGWEPDPGAFRSGADFSSSEATPDDTRMIAEWYEKLIGEVPKHVSLLGKYNPDLLKAYRNRYENTLRILPKQTEPWALLQISITRGFAAGIREGLLLARAFGMRRSQVIEAINWGAFYGGHESLSLVDEVGRTILDNWPNPGEGVT